MARTIMSKDLTEATQLIMDGSSSQVLKLNAYITSDIDDSFEEIAIQVVDTIVITEDFEMQYMDLIELEFNIHPIDYQRTIENYNDLKIILELVRIDPTTRELIDVINVYEYKIMYVDKTDITKIVSKGDIEPTTDQSETEKHLSSNLKITAQLVEPEIYIIRKKKINAIFNNINMENTIYMVASKLGIKKVALYEVSNTTVYQNVIIPPVLGIENVFNYLQNKYGIYEHGLTYYYKNDVLWIYPTFITSPMWFENVIHFYKVPINSFIGSDSKSSVISEELHVIIDGECEHRCISEELVENVGNVLLIQNKENIIDSGRTIGESAFSVNGTDNITSFVNKNLSTASKNSAKSKYVTSNNNTFVFRSELSGMRFEIITFEWLHAIPFSIQPGQRIKYHFDGPNGYTIKDAICKSVSYKIQRHSRLTSSIFTCVATVQLYIES